MNEGKIGREYGLNEDYDSRKSLKFFEMKSKFENLIKTSDVENRVNCFWKYFGRLSFDGPFAIIDSENQFVELFEPMYLDYLQRSQEAGKEIEPLANFKIFLGKMLERKCTENEFRHYVRLAHWRIEEGKQKFPRYNEYILEDRK